MFFFPRMESKKRRKHKWVYDAAAIEDCVRCINNKTHTLYSAAKAYGIPPSTIRFRIGDKWSKKTRKGPPSILSPDEESAIVVWLKDMERKGLPLVKESLLYKVKSIIQAVPRETPFKNNTPGRKWLQSFLQRNPSITLRTPEAVSAASSKVSEADIRGWFTRITDYFEEQGLSQILGDPSRIYNGDETSFFLHPKTKAVLASVGNRNVYETEHADSHTNITVMFSFGADGSLVPPDVILPLKRIQPDTLRAFPKDWGIGKSDKGWMDVTNFMLYVRNIFYPFLVRKGVTMPIVYFVDGHSSHTGAEVADLCLNLNIILVALYPNTTRITQPADVSVFKPLKNAWRSAVSEWRGENSGEILSLKYFASVLQTAINRGIKKDSIVNGFRACGLFPFCADNVDYSKCLAKGSSHAPNTPTVSSNTRPPDHAETATGGHTDTTTFTTPMYVSSAVLLPSTCVRKALDTIGDGRIRKLHTVNSLTEDEKVIRSLYDDLLKPVLNQAFLSDHEMGSVRNQQRWSDGAQTSNIMQSTDAINPAVNEPVIEECRELQMNVQNESSNTDAIIVQSFESSNMDLERSVVVGMYYVDEVTGELMELDQSEQVSTTGEKSSFSSELHSTDKLMEQDQNERVGDVGMFSSAAHSTGELMELDQSEHVITVGETNFVDAALQSTAIISDSTNAVKPTSGMRTSILPLLQTPPSPKRSVNHRNYKKNYHPVLTAGERLEELQRIEQEKENEVVRKAEVARKREEAKKEDEVVKKLKAEAREQKRRQVILKKEHRESLKKARIAKVEEQKKQKQELLEVLKLKEKTKKRMR